MKTANTVADMLKSKAKTVRETQAALRRARTDAQLAEHDMVEALAREHRFHLLKLQPFALAAIENERE